MIYYSLSVLMLAGIQDILIISTPKDTPHIQAHLGSGEQIGLNLSYKVQQEPNGIAEAFILGASFIGSSPVALMLGDNIFYGHQFTGLLKKAVQMEEGATLFAYPVKDPERFGVVTFDRNMLATSVEEKPDNPKSKFAVTGLYFYDNNVVSIAKQVQPSKRGELEITDVNNVYLSQKKCYVKVLGRGFTWMDTGTYESLYLASEFVRNVEHRQNYKVACLEEIAYYNQWIDKAQLLRNIESIPNQYADYIREILI